MALYSIVIKTIAQGDYKVNDIIDIAPTGFDWGETVANALNMQSIDNVELTDSEVNLSRMEQFDLRDKTLLANPQFRHMALHEHNMQRVLRRKYRFNTVNSKVERK